MMPTRRRARFLKWVSLGLVVTFALPAIGTWVILPALEPPVIPVPRQQDVVISDVTVLNPGVSRLEHQTIAIRNGQISEIRPMRKDDPQPICKGCFAIPGLIDAHVHTPPKVIIGNQRLFALLYLKYGVTSVQDLGQSDASVTRWADTLNSGTEVGPHVYRCGQILDGREPGWPSALSVRTQQQGRTAVQKLAADGVDCIKTYNHVDRATFEAISQEASQHDLTHIGHVPHLVGLAGTKKGFQAQHLTGFPYLHRKAHWDNDIALSDLTKMTDNEIDEAIEIARQRQITLTPTLANATYRLTSTDPSRFFPSPGAGILPDAWSTIWNSLVPHPANNQNAINMQLAGAKSAAEISGRARAAGIDVLAGTDVLMPWVVPGESLHSEIEVLAAAFGDNEAALAAATTVNGRHIGKGKVGLLVKGARADILLLPSDPIQKLSVLQDWRIMFAAGRRYDRHAIDQWVEIYRNHFHSWFYEVSFSAIVDIMQSQYASDLKNPS